MDNAMTPTRHYAAAVRAQRAAEKDGGDDDGGGLDWTAEGLDWDGDVDAWVT